MTSPTTAADALARIRREDHARLLAALAARFGDVDLAEDVAQEAFATALESWPRTGLPETPLAWLMTTATRKAIDRLRRDRTLSDRLAALRVEEERRVVGEPTATLDFPDERLAMLFACCHPTLRPDEQIALTLRYVGGLSSTDIAAAFLVPRATMQQRLVRAKRRIRETRIPVRVPGAADFGERLPAVLRVIYVIFTEGYASDSGDTHLRPDLGAEAIRLGRLTAALLPDSAEVTGLLALMLLTEARSGARVDESGLPVPLEEQDRDRWDRERIEEGITLAERAAGASGAGPYAIQAAIAAVHAEAASVDDTDWAQIVALYTMLARIEPGPIVELGLAVATGRRDGPDVGLARLDALAGDSVLERHHPYHAARAATLEKLGRTDDAGVAWQRAAELAGNAAERAYLEKRQGRAGSG